VELTDNTGGGSEDQNDDRDTDSKGRFRWNEDSLGNCNRVIHVTSCKELDLWEAKFNVMD
jgi:hypothetical protein